MKRIALVLALFLVGCQPPAARVIPWDSDLNGGTLIYHTLVGMGFCTDNGGTFGANGCPTRIVQVGATCVTETYRSGNGWEFRDSKACDAEPIR